MPVSMSPCAGLVSSGYQRGGGAEFKGRQVEGKEVRAW